QKQHLAENIARVILAEATPKVAVGKRRGRRGRLGWHERIPFNLQAPTAMRDPARAKGAAMTQADQGFGDPAGGEPFLLTPGPLTTSRAVKAAMQRDWGSWDGDFRAMTARLRGELLGMIAPSGAYDCVPMQGSGTFVV